MKKIILLGMGVITFMITASFFIKRIIYKKSNINSENSNSKQEPNTEEIVCNESTVEISNEELNDNYANKEDVIVNMIDRNNVANKILATSAEEIKNAKKNIEKKKESISTLLDDLKM